MVEPDVVGDDAAVGNPAVALGDEPVDGPFDGRPPSAVFVPPDGVGGGLGPTAAVYSATKFAAAVLSEGLRQESRDVRVTVVSPGFTRSELTDRGGSAEAQAAAWAAAEQMAIPASAIADAIAFAMDQSANVDVNELIMRPTAQG